MKSQKWGHLEMHQLLSEDLTHFNVDGRSSEKRLKDKNKRCPELLMSLLISRCPVCWGGGVGVMCGLWGRVCNDKV